MIRPFLSSFGVMALAAATAAAQNAPAEDTTKNSKVALETENQAVLSEIIVTASRRAENAQRAALSIQALSQETLERANVTKMEDLNRLAPGLQLGTAGAHSPQAYIRGVGNFASQAYAETAVAYNLDGVYISRPWGTRGMFYDLERVEVLKGPQGTLYGRNASGGAINVITAKPKLNGVSGFAQVQAGNYDLIEGTAAMNLPLGETVAVRASGQVVDRDGYLSDGSDDDKNKGARLQLLWEPSADLSLLVAGHYQRTDGRGAGVVSPQLPGDEWRSASDPALATIVRAQPVIGPRLTFPRDDNFLDVDLYALTAELNWNLGFGTLTVLPAYRDGKLRVRHYHSGFRSTNEVGDKQTSLEVRLGNSDEALKWVLGGYYFDERQRNLGGRPSQVTEQGTSTVVSESLDLPVESYAAFGQATYSVTDRFRVTGGLRYTYERKEMDEQIARYTFQSGTPLSCAAGTVLNPQSPFAPQVCQLNVSVDGASLTYNNFTYKAGVEYDLAPQSMAYVNVSTGFKSGGFYSAPEPNTFRAEKLTAFDAGIKNRFLDNRLELNVEAFYWDYKDHQETFVGPTSIPGFFTLITVNAGKAKSYGADLDVSFLATPHDELNLKLQYNKTNYDVFKYNNLTSVFGAPVTGCEVGPLANGIQEIDCSGKSLIRAPLWMGTAGYSHTFDLQGNGKLTAGISTQFASASDLSIEFLSSGRQKAYAIGDFDLSYTSEGGRFVVSTFVHNIWNEAVQTKTFRYPFVSRANPLAGPDGIMLATIRAPRMYGGQIRVNF